MRPDAPTLAELLLASPVVSVEEGEAWVTLILESGYRIDFQAGAVVVHPRAN